MSLGDVPEGHIQACARVKIKQHPRAPGVLMAGGVVLRPWMYEGNLEQNQQIAHCCRHPENHEISAWYSSANDAAKGIPDVYKFHCTCGRTHVRWMLGGSDPETGKGMRPKWDSR